MLIQACIFYQTAGAGGGEVEFFDDWLPANLLYAVFPKVAGALAFTRIFINSNILFRFLSATSSAAHTIIHLSAATLAASLRFLP